MGSKSLTVFNLIFLTLACSSASAQSGRAGQTEFTFQLPFIDSESVDFDGGARANIDSDTGFGFGFQYGLSDKLMAVANITWHTTDYLAERVLDDDSRTNQFYSAELETYSVSVGGDYYFSNGAISPYVNASVGWAWVDTNIASGPTEGVCWWDPFWGYICSANTPTHDESSFWYGVGAGLRWDLNRRTFLKAGYYQNYLDYERASSSSDLGSWRLEIGIKL